MVAETTDRIETLASDADLCGCALTLIATVYGRGLTLTLALNRDPHTYTRTLTPDELAALARLVSPQELRGASLLLADLLDVLKVLTGRTSFGLLWYGPLVNAAVALRRQIAEVRR